jgi:ER lumen protein retaining receptor
MKIFFIGSTAFIIYLMRYRKPFCTTYDSLGDQFPHLTVLLPSAFVCTLIVQTGWEPFDFMWSYSLWLEALAFIPQIIMLNKIRIIENLTSHYVAMLGAYRLFYILNWVYRYQTENFLCWTQVLAGVVQTALYANFFLRFMTGIRKILKSLPLLSSMLSYLITHLFKMDSVCCF